MRSPALLPPAFQAAPSHHPLAHFYPPQEVTIEPNELDLSASAVSVLHTNFPAQQTSCRQVVDSSDVALQADAWGVQLLGTSNNSNLNEQLSEEDRNFVAELVQFAQRDPSNDELQNCVRSIAKAVLGLTCDSNNTTSNEIQEPPMRLYSFEDEDIKATLLELPIPSLLKRSQDTLWHHQKPFKDLESDRPIDEDECNIEVDSTSVIHNKQQQIKKTLPHKKRISRKLKKNVDSSQQQSDDSSKLVKSFLKTIENIPNGVTNDEHQSIDHHSLPSTSAHADRPIFICQICGEFHGEDQLKFYYHLKDHYEPHSSIILGNMQHDDDSIAIEKIDDGIVVPSEPFPDHLVDLSLDDAVSNKSLLYQSQIKMVSYDNNEKSLFNTPLKSPTYTTDDKSILHDQVHKLDYNVDSDSMDKLLYTCTQCPKTFKRPKQYEIHMKDSHSKPDEINEFSEPEDLMEGIHYQVAVEGDNEDFLQEDLSSQHSNTIVMQSSIENQDQYILPHLTIESGQVVQNHLNPKEWYVKENLSTEVIKDINCDIISKSIDSAVKQVSESIKDEARCDFDKTDDLVICPVCGGILPNKKEYEAHAEQCHMHLKEEELQQIMEVDVDIGCSDYEPGEIRPINETDIEPESEDIDETDAEKEENTVKRKPKKTLLKCVECGKEFVHRNSIIYHMLSHGGTKAHQCDICKKTFYTASALKVHIRMHSGDKPYKCIECNRKFRQWGDLKYHFISIHSDVKQHQCEYCGKNFARKYSLIIHRRIHTGEKNYRCEFCDKTFRASSYLQNHRKIHTGEKPFPCNYCGKRFRMKGDMRRHLRIHVKPGKNGKDTDCIGISDKIQSTMEANILEKCNEMPKANCAPLLKISKQELKIEKEDMHGENGTYGEFNENSNGGEIKQIVSNDATSSSSSNDTLKEETKLGSNFPLSADGSIYGWPVFIS